MNSFLKALGVLCALILLAGMVTSPVSARTNTSIVKVAANAPTVQRGKSTWVNVRVFIAHPYHANSNPASQSFLIPTTVTIAPAQGLTIGKPSYPKGKMKKFSFTTTPISVYDGTIVVRVPVTVARSAKAGVHNLSGTVRYQACDDRNCLMPANVRFNVALRVK